MKKNNKKPSRGSVFLVSKHDFFNGMFTFVLGANGDSEIGDGFPFVEFRVLLQDIFLIYRANPAVKITFQGGMSDLKANSAHFHIAFAVRPKTTKGFVGIW